MPTDIDGSDLRSRPGGDHPTRAVGVALAGESTSHVPGQAASTVTAARPAKQPLCHRTVCPDRCPSQRSSAGQIYQATADGLPYTRRITFTAVATNAAGLQARPVVPLDDAASAARGQEAAQAPEAPPAPSTSACQEIEPAPGAEPAPRGRAADARSRDPRTIAFAPVSTRDPSLFRAQPPTRPTPREVHRVLLLYSGGLDTSVMLKWIQDSYDAEVVCLTVNLGQPGEDYEVIEGKALQLGALECHVVDAREEFAREYVAAGDQGQRALRRRLPAVHRARASADRQARRRVCAPRRLRHDRPRLHRQGQRPGADRGDRRDARARAEGDRAGALLADGPRGGDRLRARARHPDQVGQAPRPAPYSIDDNLWGRSSEGRWIEDLDHAPEDDVFQLVTPPERGARRGRGRRDRVRARACPSR